MTSTAHHRRGDVLRNVVKAANSRLGATLPTDVPGVAECFRDDLDLVGALQLHWHTLMAGNIERALAEEPGDTESALLADGGDLEILVLRAWRAAQEELPGVRLLLDHFTQNPTSAEMGEAMDIANRKEWALIAVMAGQASAQDADAAEVGRRLEAKVRRPDFVIPPRRVKRLSLRERLRIVLAA
jgi:hypothetical protein